jgi:hypothetical protein
VYIDPTQGGIYYRGTEQHARRAPFLILVVPDGAKGSCVDGPYPLRALVRKVALSQCGAWMMGSARAFGHRILISGAYGSDGLPRSVPMEVYEKATDVPLELRRAWNDGGGWNDAGSEAPSMRNWAMSLLK